MNELNSSPVEALESSCIQTSNTVTVKLQLLVLLEASVAVQVTVVTPGGRQEPDGGVQTNVTPGQLSLAVGEYVTIAHGVVVQTFWGVTATRSAGHVTAGGWVSLTVTVNEQLGPAVVLQVTVVVPRGKNEPAAGVHVATPQLPVVVGAE